MMNDLKLGIRALRYAYGIKLNCIVTAGIVALGIWNFALGEALGNGFLAAYLVICVGMFPGQLLSSLNMANLVQASPGKRRMQISVPTLLNGGSMLILYLLAILLFGIYGQLHPERMARISRELVSLALFGAAILTYMGIAYKYFVAASLLLIPICVFLIQYALTRQPGILHFLLRVDISFGLAAVLGLGILAVGIAAEYLFLRLLYRAPMSKMSQSALLRREL